MPGRKFSAVNGYRYGFNGKENDNEVKGEGNQQDYGMRMYDPRLGRFLSVDPIAKSYPMLTPYQFASNRPIDGIDQDGLEWQPVKKNNVAVFYTWAGYGKGGKPVQGTVDHGTITNNGRVLTFSVHNKQPVVTKTYTNDNVGINAQKQDTWNANRKPNAEDPPIIDFTFVATKGDVGNVSTKSKLFGVGYEFSSTGDEKDLFGIRSNKLVINGKETSTGDKVTRSGYSAAITPGIGAGQQVETRTNEVGKTITTTTSTVYMPGYSVSTTEESNGAKGGYFTIPIWNFKRAAGYGFETNLQINLPAGNNSAPLYSPQYGNAPDNTGKAAVTPVDASKLKKK